jgi:uncharacterized protein
MSTEANTEPAIPDLKRLLAIGLVAGFFSALFGVGGGIVMVPLLILWLGFEAKTATATSLAAIIITASVGVAAHGALGNIAWGYALLIGIPAVAGLLLGLSLKDRISGRALTLAFAAVLVVVAVWMVAKPGDPARVADLTVARGALVVVLGVAAGALAALFGVGGGILFVPALTLLVGVPHLDAEGASLLAILPVSVVGSWRQNRAGLVDWRAAVTMGAASAITAVAGALTADVTPPRVLRILFAVLVLVTAVQLAARARAPRAV